MNASICPPIESIVWAMSSALRVAGALEEHVLDEVGDAALLLRLVARPARQPHADADGAHVRHPLREEAETIRQHVADDALIETLVRPVKAAVTGRACHRRAAHEPPQTVDRQGIRRTSDHSIARGLRSQAKRHGPDASRTAFSDRDLRFAYNRSARISQQMRDIA